MLDNQAEYPERKPRSGRIFGMKTRIRPNPTPRYLSPCQAVYSQPLLPRRQAALPSWRHRHSPPLGLRQRHRLLSHPPPHPRERQIEIDRIQINRQIDGIEIDRKRKHSGAAGSSVASSAAVSPPSSSQREIDRQIDRQREIEQRQMEQSRQNLVLLGLRQPHRLLSQPPPHPRERDRYSIKIDRIEIQNVEVDKIQIDRIQRQIESRQTEQRQIVLKDRQNRDR